ncbi:hypothetical protein J2852_002835 [Azospirillum soli]|nr:hypothetical protein [Azospirillum soli]
MHSGVRERQPSRVGCDGIAVENRRGVNVTGDRVVVVWRSGYSSRTRRPEPSP